MEGKSGGNSSRKPSSSRTSTSGNNGNSTTGNNGNSTSGNNGNSTSGRMDGRKVGRLEGKAILSPLSFDHLWLVHLILWHSFYWPPMSGLRSQTGSLDYVVYQ